MYVIHRMQSARELPLFNRPKSYIYHISEEIGSAMAALKILGNDVVVGRKVHLATPAPEDPGPTQRLYEQPPHAYLNEFFSSDITE